MIGQVVSQGVYYYVYQWAVEVIMKLKNITKASRMTMLDNVIVAAVAGIATVLASTPVWTINMRMTVAKKAQIQSTPGSPQSTSQGRKSLLGTAMEIIQERGIPGLWSGLLPALILVSNPIIQYVLFERLKILIARRRERGRLTDADNFWYDFDVFSLPGSSTPETIH
jgi:solute carrier family 25 (peroxisomal adenine nucleotide transporter), member 17